MPIFGLPFPMLFRALLADATESCGDRLNERLDQIEVQWHLTQANVDDRKYMDIVIGAERLKILDLYIQELHLPGDEIENILVARLKLKEKLGIPISTKGMLHAGCASITQAQLNDAEQAVKYRTRNSLQILSQSPHWQKRLQARHPVVFEGVSAPFHEQLEKLSEDMPDEDYRSAIASIEAAREKAIQNKIIELTRELAPR